MRAPGGSCAASPGSSAFTSSITETVFAPDCRRTSSVTDGTNTIASFSYIGTRPKVTTFQNGTTDNRTYGGFREEVTSIHVLLLWWKRLSLARFMPDKKTSPDQ